VVIAWGWGAVLPVRRLYEPWAAMKATSASNDRRYAIIESSDAHANNQKYFGPIIRELAADPQCCTIY
jgi:hypothetical protein